MSDSSAHDPLADFPASVQADHAAFLATGDLAAADRVILAIVMDHIPDKSPSKGTLPADDQRLVEDLGFDSLALAEVVFFVEDVYQLRINQDELGHLATVGQLRAYVRDHLQSLPPRA